MTFVPHPGQFAGKPLRGRRLLSVDRTSGSGLTRLSLLWHPAAQFNFLIPETVEYLDYAAR
jgi:hypothetical protein